MTVNPTDKFLVNRDGYSYNVDQQDLMAQLEDDDLLLVNRNSKSYKITGAEFKDSLSSPPIIQSVTLTEDDPAGARFTSQDFTTTAVMLDNGNPASTKSIRGWVEGQLNGGPIETDELIGTALSDGYYAPTLTTNGTMPPDEEKKKPFDGTLSILGIAGDETTWMEWDFGTDFAPKSNGAPYVLKIELRNTGSKTVDVFVDGSDTRVEPDSDNYPDADREFVVSIPSFQTLRLMGGTNGPNCRRITVDGVVLRDADVDLTFASNKDLNRLKVGDYVTQDNTGNVTNYSSTMTGADAGTPASRAFDGVTDGDSHRAMGSTLTWDATPYDLAGPVDVWTINSRTVEVVGSNGNQSLSAPAGSTSSKLSFNDLGTVQTIRTTAGSGIIYGIAVNGNLLVDGVTTFIDGTVTQIDVDSDRISVTYDNDPFGPPNEGRYVIGPDAPVDEIKKYLNLDASLNVIGLTDDDSYTRIPGNTTTPKISFPATLDNGEAPDAALPDGTSIQTEILAENTAGSDEMASLPVTPSPSCISGPIETDVIIDVNLNATGPVYSTNNDGAAMDSPWSNAFDGDTSTFAETFAAVQSTLTFSPAVDFSKLEIYAAKTGQHVGLTINENVVPDLTGTSPSTAIWQNITPQVTSPLRSLELSRGQGPGGPNKGGILMAVRVDDKILIDGESQTALTFASDKNLAKLQPGNTIYQEDATLQPALFFNTGFVNNRWDNPPAYTALDPALIINDVPVGDYFTFPGGSEYSMWQCWSDLPGGTFRITFKLDSSSDPRNLKVWFSDNGIEWTQQANVPFKDLTSGSGGVEFNTQYLCLSWDDGSSRFGSDLYTVTGGSALQPYGKVGSIDVAGNSLTLSDSHGTWGPANANPGHYAIGPNYICPPITLDADDPDDVETFYAIKAALVQYESERIEFRELLITALTDAGFTAQQIASVMRE